MERASVFSYICNACGRCCRDKVIALSPYDVIAIARAALISTGEAVRRYTIRRGSILKFSPDGDCSGLDGARCSLHSGRPLACRLYPLGMERDSGGVETFVRLEPAPGSAGVYGLDGTVAEFLAHQNVAAHLEMSAKYAALLPIFRRRIASATNFERIEPREFWRVAIREALAESGYDPNRLIDALFDADALGCAGEDAKATANGHLGALAAMIESEADSATLAAAAVLLAVSLGYSPGELRTAV
ncbi:MAG TPA: YkgJ family cysteine cluster protein [Candidatus Binataceae bacterium]|nr:YkgJ family cysteine cluster protein [Candidatus Binataceae bacterium]